MSRIGKQLIEIPEAVSLEVVDNVVVVKGPKGELKQELRKGVTVEKVEGGFQVKVADPEKKSERAYWGLFASLIKNMVQGVTQGFEKQLEVNGVGYKVALQGDILKLELGFSHSIEFKLPEGVEAKVEKNLITISGSSKQIVGQAAADIRKFRKPEPYKGKGIRYSDEVVRRKAGKAAKAAA